VLGASSLAGVVLLSLGVVFVVASGAALYLRGRTRGKEIEIPVTLRPGPSDTALETPLLHKLQGWGVLLVAFMVVWFPVTWLVEPDRNLAQEEELRTIAYERGQASVQLFSEANQLGVGCVRCHGPELRGGVVPFLAGYIYPPNLTNICAGPFGDPPHNAIFSAADIYQVIEEGRGDPKTMPSWSIRFEGALDDQQINDIVVFLIDQSSENIPFEDNVCLNPDATTRALKENEKAGSPVNPRDP
jgi:mono/diheme cytochrome c family protein